MKNKVVVLASLGFLLLASLACNESGGGMSPIATPAALPSTATPLPSQEDWQLWADQHRPVAPTLSLEVPSEWAAVQAPFTLRSNAQTTELFVNGSSVAESAGSLTGTLTLEEGMNTVRVRAVSAACPNDVNLRQFGCVTSEANLERQVLVDMQPPIFDYYTEAIGDRFSVWGEVRDGGVGPEELTYLSGFEMHRLNVSQGAFNFRIPYAELGDSVEVRLYDRLGNEGVHRIPVAWPARWVLYTGEGRQVTYRLDPDFMPFSLKEAGLKALFGWGNGNYWVQYDGNGVVVRTVSGTNDTALLVMGGLILGTVGGVLVYAARSFFAPLGKVLGQMSKALDQAQQEFAARQSRKQIEHRVDPALPDIQVKDVEAIFIDVFDRPPQDEELAIFIEENNPFVRSQLRRR